MPVILCHESETHWPRGQGFCDVGADPSGARTKGRAIWTLATSHNLVHDNHIHNSSSHSLDFDAYTGESVAYNNLCEYCSEEGIFVEETAHDNMVFNNTCANNGNGIGIYSNAVGPVANNKVNETVFCLVSTASRVIHFMTDYCPALCCAADYRQHATR
jgi:parallel beta-helix repeat protein